MTTLRTLTACSACLFALAAGLAQAQDKPGTAAAKPAAKATAATKAAAPKATVDAANAVKPAATAEPRSEGQHRYKSKDGSPCHHDKAVDA